MLASVMRDVWPETFTFLPAGSLPEAEARLAAGGIDCVLAEPAGSACAPLARLRALAPAVPVVVLTDQADEERALAAVRAGAQDVLAKGADGGAVGRALLYVVERKGAEQGLLDVARLHASWASSSGSPRTPPGTAWAARCWSSSSTSP
jgi:DNA-binding NarL/FixJ family response regulator